MNTPIIPFPAALLPVAPDLCLEDVHQTDQVLVIALRSTCPTAACPRCHQVSPRIHSRYVRHPADVPWGGHPVRFVLHVRKFRCLSATCPRRIFTERLPEVVAPSARSTVRLTEFLCSIAFALGGEAGARLARCLGAPASPTMLLALIRRTPLPPPATPRVLGVDDWARRKGSRYGTALVDLERHQLVDLLSDRTAESFSTWLATHPGVAIIARDRGEPYATGARQGSPEAVQVVDRWHLLANWREAVERVLERHRRQVQQVHLERPARAPVPAVAVLPPKSVNRRRKYAEERRAHAQARRQARYAEIQERYATGQYLTTIARDLHLNYKTVRKYALADACPATKPYPPRRRLLAPYEPYLVARWAEGCRNGTQLYRELVAHGFRGSRTLVAAFVARLRRAAQEDTPLPTTRESVPLTPHAAAYLLVRRPERRSAAEHAALAQLRTSHAEIGTVMVLTERFAGIVRERRGAELGAWLADAQSSGIRELRQFALKVRKDEAAVQAGCALEWSNGQTEGQITRLKLLRRQMYGRAQDDLLRQRARYAA